MTKERLKKYIALKKERDQLKARLEEVNAQLYSIRTSELTGMPKAHDVPNDVAEKLIDKKTKLANRYNFVLLRLEDELLKIETAIEAVEDATARSLLRLRYIDGLTWEEVCVHINYGWTQTHKLHAKALRLIENK